MRGPSQQYFPGLTRVRTWRTLLKAVRRRSHQPTYSEVRDLGREYGSLEGNVRIIVMCDASASVGCGGRRWALSNALLNTD